MHNLEQTCSGSVVLKSLSKNAHPVNLITAVVNIIVF